MPQPRPSVAAPSPRRAARPWRAPAAWAPLALAVVIGLGAALGGGAARAASLPPGVAWQAAATDADIERAFAHAKATRKPVLLYWGATWCPPCNQLKATLFNRQDFIERAKGFVAVHLDGDGPGAQKLGGRFKVRGYPTMILMTADGAEITRLPGEVDAPQVMAVLQLGLAGGRPVKAVLADARAGKPVSGPEWRMLAWYGWDIDEAQLVPAPERPALLAQLSNACPPAEAEAATRLLLKGLAESDDGKGIKPDAALRQKVLRVLNDAKASRAQMDVLVNQGADLARALALKPGAEREAVVGALNRALDRLQADASLSRADRLSALLARVEIARLDQPKDTLVPKLDAALQRQARDTSAQLDREVTDGFERQAVITSAAYLLGRAGLWTDSDGLLKANLQRSHSPYYLMSQLGSNARKQGRTDEALRWYEESFTRSEGPATRLQWGAGYLNALVDLAPQDAARIERAAAQVLAESAKDPAAFHERSARSLQRVGTKLSAWNKDGQHDAVIRRLQGQLAPVCAKVDAADGQRATCEGLLKTAPRGKA